MKIFITGIAGFIGFHAATRLIRLGWQVEGCDHFNSYYDPKWKEKRAALLEKEGVVVHRVDLLNRVEMEAIFCRFNPSHVLHLAAQAGVRYSIENPMTYVTNNLEAFVLLLELIRKNPKIRFVFASSSSVYGANEKIPFAEEDRTDLPCSLYAATKKSNEVIAHAYHHLYKIPMIGLRFFTVYGPWGRPDMAYFQFLRKMFEGEAIEVYHGGRARRDFTYIDDIIDGVVQALSLDASFELFNLGSEDPRSVEELIGFLEKFSKKRAKVIYTPSTAGDVEKTYAELSKSKQRLSFYPKISLEQGIERFVSWFQENNNV